MIEKINWVLLGDNLSLNEKEQGALITQDLYDLFCYLFGIEITNNEYVIIYKDSSAKTPMLVTNQDKLLIRIASPSFTYWCQFIYQLSHELTHYISRQINGKSNTVSWFEETLCEAMSLYCLHHFYTNWENTRIGQKNLSYKSSIKSYLDSELNNMQGEFNFNNINNFKDLLELDKISQTPKGREKRSYVRNQFYNLFLEYPKDIKILIDYNPYAEIIKKEIDKAKWINNSDSPLLKSALAYIPKIEEIG